MKAAQPTPLRTTLRQPALACFAVQFIRADDGVTSIEYALIGSLIAMAIVVSVGAVGTQLAAFFNSVAADF